MPRQRSAEFPVGQPEEIHRAIRVVRLDRDLQAFFAEQPHAVRIHIELGQLVLNLVPIRAALGQAQGRLHPLERGLPSHGAVGGHFGQVLQRLMGPIVCKQRLPQEQAGRRRTRPQRERALEDVRRRLGLPPVRQRGAQGQPVLQLERIQIDGVAEQPHALFGRPGLSSPLAELRRQLQPPLRIGHGRVHLRLQAGCAHHVHLPHPRLGRAGAP